MNKTSAKFISGLISISILVLLFMLGPADAFILSLSVSDKSPTIGDIITFNVSAEVESGEIVPINYFIFKLTGKEDSICKFDVNGTIIEGCKGIEISLLSSPEFGFGYGFGYGFKPGTFKFQIKLDTSDYPIGTYDTKLIASISTGDKEFSGDKISINAPIKGVCSVRAEDGLLKINNKTFEDNKLNFIVPLHKASPGKGFLTGQGKRERFLYQFDVLNIIENNNKTLSFLTSGSYRLDQHKGTASQAIVTIDKKTKKASVIDDAFKVKDMDISLIKGC